jgi:hypothetical protein
MIRTSQPFHPCRSRISTGKVLEKLRSACEVLFIKIVETLMHAPRVEESYGLREFDAILKTMSWLHFVQKN